VARIDALFDGLLARKGSDLHLAIGYPPLARVRGDLVALRVKEVDAEEMASLLFEIVEPHQKDTIEDELDFDFAYPYGDKARFRASYFYRKTGLGAAFRIIPATIASLDDLGAPNAIKKLADRASGLVLVTGPTGSGKTTTLAAMIHHINHDRRGHILTIEDPIEFVHEPAKCEVTHREVGVHARNFADAIRAAGRENADVILIGELRTNESMKLALQLASFGVLVFSTVHTNSAAATVDRILNAFPAEEQPQVRGLLAESLMGVVAQQLLQTADGKGRIAAHEILMGSSALSSMIREGKTHQIANVIQGGQKAGMQTLDMALEKLVKAGTISTDTATERATDKEYFLRMLEKKREL